MKIIRFSRAFVFTAVFSLTLIVFGLIGYFVKGGFNLGIDFQAGLIQEVQFAPRAVSLTYHGSGNAVISLNRTAITIAISGTGVQGRTYQYLLANYESIGAFTQDISQIDGIAAESVVSPSTPFRLLVLDSQSNPQLGSDPYWVHYLPRNAGAIPIDRVRSALEPLGEAAVQIAGDSADRHFMIRMQDSVMAKSIAEGRAKANDAGGFDAGNIAAALETVFGEGEVAVVGSSLVGSRFSRDLTNQAAWLLLATLILILIYASVRFHPQYAAGAVLAILHDGLIMVAFVVWTRMEFNTTTIAAILTILGYSINDTIVIFDRMRENRKIYPDDTLTNILNRSVTETLSRTFITTLTTMLAVVSLYIFTTGSMKDFALALLVGMTSGVYSTIFIASGFVLFWERFIQKGKKERETPDETRAEG
jgi:preprotein translocase subunit SecF